MALLNVAALSTLDLNTPGTTTYDPVTLGLLSVLNINGPGVNVVLNAINAVAGSTINVANGASITVTGLSVGALNTFNIGTGGTLVDGATLSALSPINFVGTGGTLVLSGTGISLLSPVSGFTAGSGNEIKTSGTIASYAYAPNALFPTSGGTLTITNTDGSMQSVALNGSYTQADFVSNPDGSIGIACFARGTLLNTPTGSIAVEHLQIGDALLAHSGRTVKVKWIGHRAYTAHAATPLDSMVAPVRIRQDALAAGIPSRDLVVSPEHAMFMDGVLVPARELVNGTSIVQDFAVAGVEYFHVELDRHDIILAENAPTESWLDTGNRHMFDNAGSLVQLRPDKAPATASSAWRNDACAKLVDGGPLLVRIRNRLAARARLLGWDAPAQPVSANDSVRTALSA